MSMIIDHIDVLQKKLDMAIDVLPGLKGEIAHSEQEILGLLSQVSSIDLIVRVLRLANGWCSCAASNLISAWQTEI